LQNLLARELLDKFAKPQEVAKLELSREKVLDLYHKMNLTRFFEEQVDTFFAKGMIHGTTHLYVGEEAVGVGACAALEPGDYITATHRGHGQVIGKGADPKLMMAELMGKATGYCKGKGGSMHIADLSAGIIGANGVVGGGIPLAVGAALALKMQKRPQVVLCFFGDGAVAQGSFHEAANLAGLWKLPVVFVCENNQYGMSIPVSRGLASLDFEARAATYAMAGESLDGNDVLAVLEAVDRAVRRARAGEGPSLLECRTYRWKGHSKSDANRYRSREEIEAWKARCPIKRFRAWLIEGGYITAEEADRLEAGAKEEIDMAVRFAMASPDPSPEEVETDVYA